MKSSLQKQFLSAVSRHRLWSPGDVVGVAVSGGGDSVALLRLLHELRLEMGIRISVVHFNHQLRGADSDADEKFAAGLASECGVPFFCAREDVAAAARAQRWNLEDAGRRLRYKFFASLVQTGRATRIATAHSADDQAETVLAHILRGAGPTGLAAIFPVVGHVVRPLLDIRRADLREYLRSIGQAWREDASNEDTGRLRARIRRGLLPQLASEFQPEIVARLGQLASLAREDAEFWELLVADRLRALTETLDDGIAIRVEHLFSPMRLESSGVSGSRRASTDALTKRLIRRIVGEVRGRSSSQLGAQHVEQVLHLATCRSGSRLRLPGGVIVEKTFDQLIFAPLKNSRRDSTAAETVSFADTYEYQVELDGLSPATISVPEIGRRFVLKVIDWPSVGSDTRTLTQALDWDLLRSPLVLRNWRPGDSYQPCGRRHVHKMKRLLLASRIPARARCGWPVMTSGENLVWARGLPVAESFAARASTQTGLLVVEEELESGAALTKE